MPSIVGLLEQHELAPRSSPLTSASSARSLMQQNDNFAVGTGPGTPNLRLLAEHVSKGLSDRWAAVRVRSPGRLPGSPRLAPCQTPRRRTDRHTRAAVEEERVLQVPRILRVVVWACQNAVPVGEQVVPATLGHHFGRRRLHSLIGGVRRVRGRFVGSGPVGVRQAALNVLPPGAPFATTRATCFSTVRGDRNRVWAMSWLVAPRASSFANSSSRGDSWV
jgi:hypothetical protein